MLLAVFGLSAGPVPTAAQDFGRVVSPILTLDREQLFAGTRYGQRVNRELEAASTAMAAETRAIEAALEAEEQALTEQRATMDTAAFRELASAFDDKVQALRAEREAAESDLLAQIEAAQLAFFNRIGPVLGQLVRDRGAVLIVDRRAVLLAATDIDITSAAIERIDAVLGDGGDLGGSPGAAESPAPDTPAPVEDTTGEGAVGVDTIPAPEPPAEDPDASPED
jgi:Skp family chaperone for outer membrane proteins